MKIFVFGGNGMLGRYVVDFLRKQNINVISLCRRDYDITCGDYNKLEYIFVSNNSSANDVVINCSGTIPHSTDNHDYKSYILVNTVFPIKLEIICSKYCLQLIHITTDCIYSGVKGKYVESDPADSNAIYGVSKFCGEHLSDAMIIRTSIIGQHSNHQKSLLEWVLLNNNNEIDGYTNSIWNGVTCLELAKIIYNVVITKKYWKGIRHIFSDEIINKYQLINMIKDIYDLNININRKEDDPHIDRSLVTKYEPIHTSPLFDQICELKAYQDL